MFYGYLVNCSMACRKNHQLKNYSGGFSLPELVITIGIIVMITAVILVRYANFNSSVLLSSQAFEIGLDIREAQVFGLGVRGEGSGTPFRDEYGVFFDTTTDLSRGQYLFFQDSDNDPVPKYDAGTDYVLSTLLLDARHRIESLCTSNPTTGGCPAGNVMTELSVTFKRPNFDARFFGVPGGSGVTEAYITISPINSTSETRTVKVTNTGQIEVLK